MTNTEAHTVRATRLTDRTVEITGMTNTAGQGEVYRVTTLWNGQHQVFVQRTNGRFAILNPNKHQIVIARVVRTANSFNV